MHDEDHGHSAAAWTGTGVMLLAAAVACYAAVFGPVVLMWVGIGLFLVGALVWYAMARAGHGSAGPRTRS
jgi:multisubunit Na+/H+ antiporter MnhG subunit